MAATSHKTIRRQVRQQRRELSEQQQAQAAYGLRSNLKYLTGFMSAHHVGVYLTNDGEIDPRLIVSWLWHVGKRPYLPVLATETKAMPSTNVERRGIQAMRFAEYHPRSISKPNQYGIPEPICGAGEKQMAQSLDVILMPLVAFDDTGNRIGMGGGYYDRTLAFRQHQTYTRRPKLIGIAHSFQQLNAIKAQSWDIPLDAVVTDKHVYTF